MNGAAGANANNVDEYFEEVNSCPECDELNRYHKKESDWVQLAVLPLTAAWKIQDGELNNFGNKLCEKASLLVRVINLRYPIVDEITTLLAYVVNEVPWDETSVKNLVHRRWIQLVCQSVISLQSADPNATATPDEPTRVIAQAMLVLTRFKERIEEEDEEKDEGEDTLETFKNEFTGFRDAWNDAHENGLHHVSDAMYEEGSSGQRRVARMGNNDQSNLCLYNALRAKHEYAAFVAHIKRTEAGRDSVARFQELQQEDHEWDRYPYPPMTEREVKSFRVGYPLSD